MGYHFDMHSIFPDERQNRFQGMFNDLGVNAATTQQIALRRDPRVVEALRRADHPVRELFIKSGFGVNGHDGGRRRGAIRPGTRRLATAASGV